MKQTKEEILKKYYQLWKDGHLLAEIQKQLGLTDKKFKALDPDFLAYCRHHSKFDKEETPLSEPTKEPMKTIKEQFIAYASTGLGYDQISKLLNIPLIEIMDKWFKKDSDFKLAVDNAIIKADAQVHIALHERAIGGFEAPTKTTTTTTEIIKNEGGEKEEVTQKVESNTSRFVAGDVNAQKFWLINRKPDEFSLDGVGNRGHSKGKILEAIDEVVNTKNAEELDSKYQEG